jgi:LacI family transcriptional regulator
MANTDNDPERERLDWQTMRARQVDGIIAATARRDHKLLDEIVGSQLPLVLVNRRTADGAIPAATADDRAGIRLAVNHLVEQGHTRIAHVAGPLELSTGFDRHDGFVAAIREAGLRPDPGLIVTSGAFTEAAGALACRRLLDADGALTAIVAANDLIALGCYDVFAERGIDCPGAVSVVGFNDMPFADRFSPPLTTIRIPHYEIGQAAAELMLECLQDGTAGRRQMRLQPELVVRESTARPAG